MHKVFLSLGSNLGDKLENLNNAITKISLNEHIKISSCSNIYQSKPMYNLNQDDFLNMVIEIETNFRPLELMKYIKDIEILLGRSLDQKHNYPRIIDIDILDYENQLFNTPELTIPHPKLFERMFVLKPWSEISPDYVINNGKTIKDLMLLLDSNNNYVKFCCKKI
tara:strand:- start:281 stop:778 length:498 start_codon:yes stop_codon:yes gene_type:complete